MPNASFLIEYAIYMLANPIFDAATEPSYTIHVECTDETAKNVTDDLTVDVNPDQPPVISSLPAQYTIHENTINREKIHDIVVTDPEGKDITCTLDATVPVGGPFDVWEDASGESSLDFQSQLNIVWASRRMGNHRFLRQIEITNVERSNR